ncbi:MAG: hypothetical protein HQL99_15295 [Magnetococcales bacterium]|nr:hypothetical protein [Magnetococcales bacterium]
MFMTKQEARNKWCCQARLESVRQVDRNVVVPCISDACMAWRWRKPKSQDEEMVGFCGMAGVPVWS